MARYLVTLEIDILDEQLTNPPHRWDWNSLLDLGPDEIVKVISSSRISDVPLNNDEDDDAN
jgi:hypothetical protein